MKLIRLTDDQYDLLLWILTDDMHEKVSALEHEFSSGPFDANIAYEMKAYLELAQAIRDGTKGAGEGV